MNTCTSVTINPNYISTGLFSAPHIEFRSQYPRMLRNNIDKKEFDEILQSIGTFVNAEFSKIFGSQTQNYVSNIPCFLIPILNLFKMNSLQRKYQEEYLEFEKVVDDYIYKLNNDLLLEEKGVEVLSSWQEMPHQGPVAISPHLSGIGREIRLVFNLI
mmetsp:Transcript_25150/g.42990  ORF Transcript_25150/g.42990 Transcript_25150/m.42990 type:complete len:158 (+) Transcript_25150:101-574(+)